jgi:hypothetical protein
MPRKKIPKGRDQDTGPSDAEYTQFAEKFVDLMIHPEYQWLLHYFLAGGFSYFPQSKHELALDIIREAQRGEFLVLKELADAAEARDRGKLIAIVKSSLADTKPSSESMDAVLRNLRPSVLRGAIRDLESIFKLQRGPNPKIPTHKYPELATRSNMLTPIIERLLLELKSGTKVPVVEFLKLWKIDHPEGCAFLLCHLSRLQQAMDDPSLLKRGTKIKSRARVLADAMAGSDYNLSFLTSRDRASAARRNRSTSR